MQASDWAGGVGETWAQEWRRTDRTFVPVDGKLVETIAARLEAIQRPRILDVGCGAGATSLSIAARLPSAIVTGIDLSPALAATATVRAGESGEPGRRCHFIAADAGAWDGEGDFDLIASRHGVMFFGDPVATFAHIRTRARPGAALVFSCFRAASLNHWASGLARMAGTEPPADPYAPGPFAFAEPDHVAAILAAAGWRDAAAVPLDFAYVAGAGDDPVADAAGFFLRIGPTAGLIREADGAERERLIGAVRAFVAGQLVDGRVMFPAAAWIWSAVA